MNRAEDGYNGNPACTSSRVMPKMKTSTDADRLAREQQIRGQLADGRYDKSVARLDLAFLLNQIAAERQARAALEQAALGLVAKLDECIPHIANAFVLQMVHGAQYQGPNFAAELKAMRALLPGAGEQKL